MTSHGRDKTGKIRVRCSTYVESGSCSNNRVIYLNEIEHLVFQGLLEKMTHPEMMAAYVAAYSAETLRSQVKSLNAERDKLAADLAACPTSDKMIALHPGSVERYRQDLAKNPPNHRRPTARQETTSSSRP